MPHLKYTKDLVKRVNEDYHLMLKQLDKISKHETLVNELSIRIMNLELIETMVSLHKEEVLNSKVPIHETLQQSRNNIIAHNENILLYIKRYKSITKYQNEINKLNNRLEELDKKIHETTRSMEGLKDNQFVYMQNNQDIHLSIKNLKMYFGGLKAVDDLTFDIKRGEIFSLIGPNGAGKTTVFNCITKFYKPTGGRNLL